MQPTGRPLGGRYELTALIATGGMGQVWQARDTVLNRDVAVKVLRSEFTGDPTFLARFRAEAQLAAGLVHPNIATLFDYGEVQPESPTAEHLAYLVMELVRGESLSDLLGRERRLSPDRTLDVLRQSAAGLAAAHAAGVVHRDVKPGNVLLASDGTVKITDFGVAVTGSSLPLTQTGQVIGTAHYLSPEQAQGDRATPASDVYALGVVGYECLSGHRVFDAESSVQIALMQIRNTPEPLPDDVPPAVRGLVEAAMVKDPARRIPDGAAFRDAIDDVIAGRRTVHHARTAVLPAVPAPAATTVAATAGRAQSPPTRVLPVVTPDPAPEPEERRRRRPGRALIPLVGLLALAAIVLGGLRLLGNTADDGTTTQQSPSATSTADDGTTTQQSPSASTAPSAIPSTPPTPSVRTVDLSSGDYEDRPVSEVQEELTTLGLVVTLRPKKTDDIDDGLVISVAPDGELPQNSPVTVTYAVARTPATSASENDGEDQDEPDENESDGDRGNGNGRGNG